MARHGIPTARYRVCDTPARRGRRSRRELGFPVVVKADGLAAGKGVVVAPMRRKPTGDSSGDGGAAVRRRRRARGARRVPTVGPRYRSSPCATGVRDADRPPQDHKRVFDDDEGPNTGGMGAFSPSPLVDDAPAKRIMREIVEPVIAGMRAEGHEYAVFSTQA